MTTRSALALTRVHARYVVLEQLRIPIAVLATALFPALSLVFFVLPFDYAADPTAATAAVAQLTLFGVSGGFLFTVGVGVADDRNRPWDPYLRTLPAPPPVRIAARVVAGIVFAVLALIPVVIVGATLTAATATPVQLLAATAVLVVASLPLLFAGLTIGYSLPAKAAVPVVQLVYFPAAFLGGLLLPPTLFPSWLETVSQLLPTRGGRDLLVWALGGPVPTTLALVALAVSTVALALLAGRAYRRDEGRRFF